MKHDLDPCDLEPLIAGSARVRNMDEAELRTHQLRNERHGQLLRKQYAPPGWSALAVICVLVAAAFIAWTWYVAGPPPFFNWSK